MGFIFFVCVKQFCPRPDLFWGWGLVGYLCFCILHVVFGIWFVVFGRASILAPRRTFLARKVRRRSKRCPKSSSTNVLIFKKVRRTKVKRF